MPVIRISDETFNLLCQLRKKVPATTPAELVEWLAERGASDIGIVVEAINDKDTIPTEDTLKFRSSEQLRQDKGTTISSELRDTVAVDVLSKHNFAPIYGETAEISTKKRHPSKVLFSTFSTSQLVNVKPIRALVKGHWFKISYWNRAAFAAIKALVDEGVAIEEIVEVLNPLIKIGNPEGSIPIKGQNISHMFINTPKISWKCVEKLYDCWGIDVRVRFRWNNNAPEELRGRSYEIRTGYSNLVAL